jgi:hypothetical protein
MSLADDFASLAEDLEIAAGEPVTYERGEDGAVVVIKTAVRQRSTHERFAIADGRVSFEEVPQDWCIRPELIHFGGIVHTPTRGDRITDEAGRVYQVEPRSEEPAVRLSDAYGVMLRIRTVLRDEPD